MAGGAWHAFGRQLALPRGAGGRLTGHLMRYLNSTPYRLAIDALDVGDDCDVLELGFGPGEGLAELLRQARHGSVHGIDASATMLAQARARNAAEIAAGRLVVREGDFARLPFADGSFDRVLAVNVAYFWNEAGSVPREICRVLRAGGRLSVYVTDQATMRGWPFAGAETHRLFDADALLQTLAAGGFPTEAIEVRATALPHGVEGLVAIADRL